MFFISPSASFLNAVMIGELRGPLKFCMFSPNKAKMWKGETVHGA